MTKQDPEVIPVCAPDYTVKSWRALADGTILFLHQSDTLSRPAMFQAGKSSGRENGDPSKGETVTKSVTNGLSRTRSSLASPAANSAFAFGDRLQHQGRQAGLAGYSIGPDVTPDLSGEDHASW